MLPTNEGELERMREHLGAGKALPVSPTGPQARAWIDSALEYLERHLELAEAGLAAAGGGFAERIRQALEERILAELRGRAVLTNDVKAESVSVHVLPGGVWVDVRLKIGRWQQT